MLDNESIIKNIYAQNGYTVDINIPFTSYKQWESTKGLVETQGKFSVSSEKDTTHTFSIRYGKNSKDVIRIEIDGKRIMWDEDLQTKYMDDFSK